MTKITYIHADGTEQTVDAEDGESVMEAAMQNDIEGILAECGGACACATCHVYVDEAFMDKVGTPSDMEESMLEFNDYRQDNSRLSCQIKVSPALEGLKVVIPESQY
ncbi:2Fe-2S iron-sulfur cluster-binding protein [Kordiimonas marina]|uniref:2Fe-2S iron-sulfur cluster-binding protein n=1 Tax=Kordiimonas marina TaxID=2872312 RepID=UPI001FF2F3A2|nr:2Fe-2S iron-sulfur cluster-binding protein [Kordiimonas marina]MCJ9427969.1 2Fe-2S iron-sulfur cluster binding domain-containing protein [Kordiimonas marina]